MPPVPIEDKHSPALVRQVRTLLAEPESHSWRTHAECRGHDVNLFFAERGDTAQIRKAKAFCATCPVAVECLTDAIRTGEFHGIRGGYGVRSRDEIARLAGIYRHSPKKPCGTVAAYQRHYTNGETPCAECKQAYAVARAESRTRHHCHECGRPFRSRVVDPRYCSAACRMIARAKGTAA